MTEISLTIPEIHPSINVWNGWGYHKYNREKCRWAEMVGWICKNLPPMKGEVTVTVRYYFRTRRKRDIDNYTPKFIMDGLVQGGLIEDDNSNIVKRLSVEMDYDIRNSRTDVIIRPYTKS